MCLLERLAFLGPRGGQSFSREAAADPVVGRALEERSPGLHAGIPGRKNKTGGNCLCGLSILCVLHVGWTVHMLSRIVTM